MNNRLISSWQIKTVPVSTVDDDKLSHDVISELLDEKIDALFKEDNIPSCICLNGEYGSGKSTITNLLFERWNGSTNKKVIHFNIWRHEKENTYYALFRNVFYALKNKNNKDFRDKKFLETLVYEDEISSLDESFSDLVYSSFTKKEVNQKKLDEGLSNFIQELPKYTSLLTLGIIKVVFLGSLVIGSLAGLVDFIIDRNTSDSIITAVKIFLLLFTSTTICSFFSKNIFKNLPTLFKFHISPSEKSISLPSISNTEQLQSVFRNILSKHNGNPDCQNLVIVIEDIDRKHNNEIIDTLNELRTFIDLGKAIFIIPCDLNNIQRAFYESAIDKSEGIDEKEVQWKAKDFCSKIFSHTISVPPQSQLDLREFLIAKINNESECHPLNKILETTNELESLIDILLVSSIKTPREAINIFNRFTLQLEHALKLEKKERRLKAGTISKNILPYARVYMLSINYGLEKDLLKFPELPTWIVNYFRTRTNHFELVDPEAVTIDLGDNIPKYAHQYFKGLIKNGVVNLEVEEFVSRTEIYDSPLIKAFIYLDEISYSGVVGNEIYNKVSNAIKARNMIALNSFIGEEKDEISEVISKITDNLSYSSDFTTFIPSLVELTPLISPQYQRKIVKFIIEHFDRINKATLYTFEPEIIGDVFSIANVNVHKAKKRYFNVLSNEQESISDYCSPERLFEIVLMLIQNIDKDCNYVDTTTIEILKDFVNIPSNENNEFLQRERYIEVITTLDKVTITNLFSAKLLLRFTDDLDNYLKYCNDQEKSKKVINELIEIFIEVDKVTTIKAINQISQYKEDELEFWFIELVQCYQEYFKEKNSLLTVTKLIKEQIFDVYLTEEDFTDNKELLINAITQFAQLDSYAFHNFTSKNTDEYHSLLALYKKHIADASVEFLEFLFDFIYTQETVANYTYLSHLFDAITLFIKNNLINKSISSVEFEKSKILANFIVRGNLIKENNDSSSELIHLLLKQMQTHINQNQANTETSAALFEFINILNGAENVNKGLAKWIESANLKLVANNNSLASYRDYLNIIDLVKNDLSQEYLTQMISVFYSLITSYPGNETYVSLAWQWLDKIALIDNSIDSLKTNVGQYIFTNISHKESYFKGDCKKYIVKILANLLPFEVESEQKSYNDLLLWSADEYPELIKLLANNISFFENPDMYKAINIISDSDQWELILNNINNETGKYETFIEYLIVEQQDKRLITEVHDKTSSYLDWTDISKRSVSHVAEILDFAKASFINSLDNNIIGNFNILEIESEFEKLLTELLKDNMDNKTLSLDLIDKFKLQLNSSSSILNVIKGHFIDACDINTDFNTLQKLKEWLKIKKLTRESGINKKLSELQKLATDEKARKIGMLIKY
ncbi:KAP family NTPase [Vibrio splendidus]|uniref:KAP family NTPase n=1 Tax=Vibrio splendidus TaxID=29497 RepID=UPI002235F548|nr:KAP family NTPase [Vibrio splendidus]MCW4440691.1 KAP family NTPase [Vibrio splendidus]